MQILDIYNLIGEWLRTGVLVLLFLALVVVLTSLLKKPPKNK